MNWEQATNGNWFDHDTWTFYADDGFGNLIVVRNWPAMGHSSEEI